MFFGKRATRATKHMNPLPSTGFMRSTKRATFLGLLYFQMLIISIITFSMYAISRTIQNISFNTPYDLTTRIKSLICKNYSILYENLRDKLIRHLKRHIHDFSVYYKK